MKKFGVMSAVCIAAAVMLASFSVCAEYSTDNALFSAEFEAGDDRTNWRMTGANGKEIANFDYDGVIRDGALTINPMSVSYGRFMVAFSDSDFKPTDTLVPIDVAGKKKIMWETRIRIDMPQSGINADGTLKTDNQILILQDYHQNYRVYIAVRDGFLAYGGTEAKSEIITDYKVYSGKWYTIKAAADFERGRMSMYVTDGEGNDYSGEEAALSYGLTLGNIHRIYFPRQLTGGETTYIDYVRLWDEGFKLIKTSVANGADNVAADTGFRAEFSDVPSAASLENITVCDSEGNTVPAEITADAKAAELYFTAGLKYGEEYIVTIPSTVLNTEGESLSESKVKFMTEPTPFGTVDLQTDVSSGKAMVSVRAYNNGTAKRTVSILTAVYDNGTLVKMTSRTFDVDTGEDKWISCETDVSGAANPTVKAYLWDGISVE